MAENKQKKSKKEVIKSEEEKEFDRKYRYPASTSKYKNGFLTDDEIIERMSHNAVREMMKYPEKNRTGIDVILDEENHRFLTHNIALYKMPKCDMTDINDVATHIVDYFNICDINGIRPQIVSFSLALGIDKNRLHRYRTGALGKNPEIREMLEEAVSIIESLMNDWMQAGKMNPIAGIFLLKNHMGYTDKQEFEMTPTQPLGEGNQAEIEERYAESVVEDLE